MGGIYNHRKEDQRLRLMVEYLTVIALGGVVAGLIGVGFSYGKTSQKLGDLNKTVSNLPCDLHTEKLASHSRKIGIMETRLSFVQKEGSKHGQEKEVGKDRCA